ncbi:MAG: branched-chain amino acid aminotransferase [Bradyrhizobium sp.]|uniref:branched-chain amino acid aminotransferase n=1 Tax=Bradyrhizobium sp. TaxID=376 RepID=UPI001D612AD0|nr:branched-chain amino acid aminotransferase [Bradyrhizobium sp.]MBV9562305.1 branched-chain amino acid aminotransferase [Bradyrhizobium sp.]
MGVSLDTPVRDRAKQPKETKLAPGVKFDILPSPNPVPEQERAARLADPGFGRVFTDHMAIVRYNQAKGWHDARIESRANFPLDAATAVLHYAQEIFEGLKGYRREDGGVNLFRPDANARRMKDSAERMAMAPLPEAVFIEAVEQLVRIDRAWIPGGEGSLYLRPFMIASEVFLGVKPSAEYIFAVIASPVGSYFKGGPAPVSIWVSETYTRAAIGGTGAVKCGGNYAASLRAQAEAIEHGCDQVVFLDAVERRYIEELGGMNIFFVLDDGALITPPLGTILPGITRDSIIALARDVGTPVREEPYTIDQWRADAASGRLKEAFACGTAAVISPIGKVCSVNGDFAINGGAAGPVAMGLRKQLVDIQYGRAADPHAWIRKVF